MDSIFCDLVIISVPWEGGANLDLLLPYISAP